MTDSSEAMTDIWRLRREAAEGDLDAFCAARGLACTRSATITLGPYSEAVAGIFLPHFGGQKGVLINPAFRDAPNYSLAKPYKEAFWEVGYGNCRLEGRPRDLARYYEEMLRTLGWTGSEAECPPWIQPPEAGETATKFPRWLDSDWDADEDRLFTHSFESIAFPPQKTKFGAFYGWLNEFPPRLLAQEPDWMALEHQAAGHSCRQAAISGIVFSMTDQFASFASELCRDYEYALGGWLTPDNCADEFPVYRRRVERYGLSVGERHKRFFMESVYPLDVDERSIRKVAAYPLPLERLRARTAGSRGEFPPPTVYIVAENSD